MIGSFISTAAPCCPRPSTRTRSTRDESEPERCPVRSSSSPAHTTRKPGPFDLVLDDGDSDPAGPAVDVADVMVTSHGADMINAFGLHRGATVLEVMPVYQAGCPCKMYKELLSSEGGGPPVVLHYQMSSKNKSMAVTTEPRKMGTYHMNLLLPWPTLQQALLHVLGVAGRVDNYEYKTFDY